MNRLFGDQFYNLQTLFAEERHRIMRLLSRETLTRLDQLYTQVYRDNYGVLMAFHRENLDVPQELQVAAKVALSHRAADAIAQLEQETNLPDINPLQLGLSHLAELEAIAIEASHFNCKLKIPGAKEILEKLILRSLWHMLQVPNFDIAAANTEWLQRLIELGDRLQLGLSLAEAQELYLNYLNTQVLPLLTRGDAEPVELNEAWTLQLLELGDELAVDVRHWLHQLQPQLC
jgi:alpha-amylase/alpha-mannosidase (GH57 family)